VSKLRTVRLTLAEINHLYGLLYERRDSGEYAGARDQYYARTDTLIAKLNEAAKDAAHGPEEEK
jgi:hypothetical protein